MTVDATLDPRLVQEITAIYHDVPEPLVSGLRELMQQAQQRTGHRDIGDFWSERDVVLISYADQIRQRGLSPLAAQHRFLRDHRLQDQIACLHLLPFFPSTSDDGFSVADFLSVDPEFGSWQDIAALGQDIDLMFDLVLNHCSQQHPWFQRFLRREPPYDGFFIDMDPDADLAQVVRPRSLPLLTPFPTRDGPHHVWTTFSADQVDLNYRNPLVLLEMTRIMLEYVRRGARIIRLDAVAYLWKEVGTRCIHLPQTHAVVRFLRRVLDLAAPGTLLLTETNVPHAENVSYFGRGNDAAHMVYQFSLPPLLLDAIHEGDTSILANWLTELRPLGPGTTFFNFTASHDGIGVRPLEGLVPQQRVERLVHAVLRHGGRVSTRRRADRTDSPYELNITYLDAVADARQVPPAQHAARFLATQAVMLAIRGIPAVYFHSLVGTPNDQRAATESGHNRRINRHKYERVELDAALSDPRGLQRMVLDGYRRLLDLRRQQPAFHPQADQRVLALPTDGLLGWVRTPAAGSPLAMLVNLTDQQRHVPASAVDGELSYDLISGRRRQPGTAIALQPFQVCWLVR